MFVSPHGLDIDELAALLWLPYSLGNHLEAFVARGVRTKRLFRIVVHDYAGPLTGLQGK